MISATRKPRMTPVTNIFITHVGASNVAKRMEALWSNDQATNLSALRKKFTRPGGRPCKPLRRLSSIKTLAGLCLARLQGFAGEAVAIRESRIAPDSKEYGFSGRPGRIRWVNSTKSNDAVTYVRFRA